MAWCLKTLSTRHFTAWSHWRKISPQFHITGPFVTGRIRPWQWANNAEIVSIPWRGHVVRFTGCWLVQTVILLDIVQRTSVNSLWPGDAICQHRSGSTLAEAMACSLSEQSFTRTNGDFSLVRSYGISQPMPQLILCMMSFKIILLNPMLHLKGQ